MKLLKDSCQIGAMDIEVIGDLLNTQVFFIVMRLNHMLAGQVELIGRREIALLYVGSYFPNEIKEFIDLLEKVELVVRSHF